MAGNGAAACGSGGVTCAQCSTGNACVSQTCVSGANCNSQTCPNGCCVGNQCQAGTDSSACGAGGVACEACSSQQLCLFGACYDINNSCGAQSCSGCCDQGACLPGNDISACGTNGNACQACTGILGCVGGQCFSLNTGGDGGPGAPCTADTDCIAGDPFFNTSSCILATGADGGSSGWPGGYCSQSCFIQGCPDNGLCIGFSCYESCPAPGSGRSTCRNGYVCAHQTDADGGQLGPPGFCYPDCHNTGVTCDTGLFCNQLGYCQ
jgi:hypothetical protein